MGYKKETKYVEIKRKKVYIVYKWQMKPYSNEKKIIGCFTTLEKAKNWIDEFIEDMKTHNMVDEVVEERHGTLFQGTEEQFFKDYHFYDDPWFHACYYIIRINSYELDVDYDEESWVECNPKN